MTFQPNPADTRDNDRPPPQVTPDPPNLSLSGLPSIAARRVVGGGLAALLVVGLLTCAWLGWRATDDGVSTDTRQTAQGRDAAVRAATDGLAAFHTIDYRHLDELIRQWSELSTGQLHAMVGTGRKAVLRKVAQSRTVSSADVERAAVTSFDPDAGDARVVAVVSIHTRSKNSRATTRTAEFLCLVKRESDGWKLSAMQSLGGRS